MSNWDPKMVTFVCQRCLQPLTLTDFTLNEYETAELKLPIHPNDTPEIEAQDFDHFVPKYSVMDKDFLLISGGQSKPTNIDEPILSPTLQMTVQLFDILSNNSDIDHPLCEECTDSLHELLDKQIVDAESDWKDYENYLTQLADQDSIPNLEKLEAELAELLEEENALRAELEGLKKDEDELRSAISVQEEEQTKLLEEKRKHQREYNRHVYDKFQLEDERRSLDTQAVYIQNHLKKLNHTNVFQVAFGIWHNNQFGVINNFRLGRLPSVPVDWWEINAAWGQATLLLTSIARKMGLKFKKYKPVPYGNYSYIEVLSEKESERGKRLPLHGSGHFLFMSNPKFDHAMVAFLECLQQLKEGYTERNLDFKYPYNIDKGKIEDSENSYSVKVQFNSEEQWTKAMRFALTNLRWAQGWITEIYKDSQSTNVAGTSHGSVKS